MIPFCYLQLVFVHQRRWTGRLLAVLGPTWSSPKRWTFRAASFEFQQGVAISNRGLDHLLPLGLGRGRHQLLAKYLPGPFGVSLQGDEGLEFAALAPAVWGPFLHDFLLSQLKMHRKVHAAATSGKLSALRSESLSASNRGRQRRGFNAAFSSLQHIPSVSHRLQATEMKLSLTMLNILWTS